MPNFVAAMIVVAVMNSDNPETREEDYAAAMIAIQNLSLTAVELGLGSSVPACCAFSAAL